MLLHWKLAEELWPVEEEVAKHNNNGDDEQEDEDDDPEKAIERELRKIKRPKREKRFGTNEIIYIWLISWPASIVISQL